jgi:hypothetical protein
VSGPVRRRVSAPARPGPAAGGISPTPNCSAKAIRPLAAMVAALVLLACAAPPTQTPAAAPTAAPTAAATALIALRSDGRLSELLLHPLAAGGATVGTDAAWAIERATAGLGGPAGPTADARLVSLTVRGFDDGALVLRDRPVWLVTYGGRAFETDACECEGRPSRPSTAVAVDAADGAVLGAFGVAS